MKASEYLKNRVCPWCEDAGLRLRHRVETVQNGSARLTFSGYYVGCANPLNGCSDLTGCFPTEMEAVACALAELQELAA